jgi:hypothetical protein
MSFALVKQIVTTTVVRSSDAIGGILFARFPPASDGYRQFDIDHHDFASTR